LEGWWWSAGYNIKCLLSGEAEGKKLIWDEISDVRENHQNTVWCLVGDFNAIRRKEKRNFFALVSDYSSEIRS